MSDDPADPPGDGEDGANKLGLLMEDMKEAGNGRHVTLGALVEALERRGFGPMLLVLAAFLILPTGMIPGMPAAIGLLLILVAIQIILGQQRVWLPRFINEFRISGRLVRRSVDRARPWARKLGRFLGARATVLTDHHIARRVVAVTVMATGAILIPLGFIPFLPLILAGNVLLFGLGLTMRNGVMVLLGFASFAPGAWLATSELF